MVGTCNNIEDLVKREEVKEIKSDMIDVRVFEDYKNQILYVYDRGWSGIYNLYLKIKI